MSGAIIARIISQYSDKGTRAAQKDLKHVGKQFVDFGQKVKHSFELAAVASSAFAIKIGTDSVKAAIEDQKSQALLANALRNTTAASDATIASTEEYVVKQQALLGVSKDELRPSLISLAAATHDVTAAQKLQSLALDLAAGRGKDLGAVSLALGKAYLGNFTALRKMGIPISENIIKTKDFNGLVKELTASVGGQAAVAANTFAGRMERIKLSFKQAEETLGYALLPVLEKLASKVTDIIPKIQAWVDLNKDKLAAGFANVADAIGTAVGKLVVFGQWLTTHMSDVKAIGLLIGAMFVAGKVFAFVTALTKVVTVLKAMALAAKSAAVFEALATGGATLAAGLAAIAVLGIGAAFLTAGDKAATANDKVQQSLAGMAKGGKGLANLVDGQNFIPSGVSGLPTTGDIAGITATKKAASTAAKIMADQKKQEKEYAAQLKRDSTAQAALDKKNAAQNAIDAAKKLATEKGLAALKKLGVTPTSETDPIELEAARQLLVHQGIVQDRLAVQLLIDKYNATNALTDATGRYNDYLQAMKDGHVDSTEIKILAEKWGVSTTMVKDYVTAANVAVMTGTKFSDPITAAVSPWDLLILKVKTYVDILASTGKTAIPVPDFTVPDLGNGAVARSTNGGDSFDPGTGSGRGGQGNAANSQGATINLTVNGSLIHQQDIIDVVRIGLLGSQYSGKNLFVSQTQV